MRISHNNNENNNQNVVNVILRECRTKQKRKRANKPMQKQPIQMKPLEQQVNDANYKLYHIIQDRKREAQRELSNLIQSVQNKSMGIPSTDNSLIAIAREMKMAPSELSRKIEPSVADQILSPAPVTPVVVDSGGPRSYINVDEKKNSDVIMEEPNIPDEEEKGEVPPPRPPQQMQMLAEPTDIEVNKADVPIVDGEMDVPEISDIQQRAEDLKQEIQEPLMTNTDRINKYFSNNNVGRLKDKQLEQLVKKFNNNNDVSEAEGDADKLRNKRINFLKSNPGFTLQFIQQFGISNNNEDLRTIGEKYLDVTKEILLPQSGNGKKSLMVGLFNDQIDDMLRSEPNYCGCISRDEIHKLKLDDKGKYGFVYNTVPSNKPTKYEGHWRAIFIDLDDAKSIDHYDSFGEPAEEDIQEQIKKLLEQFNLPYYLKWKDNKIINQRSNSSNCGFFCVNFLQDRFEGIPFVDSTGYSNVVKSEKDLKKKFSLDGLSPSKFKYLV